VCREARSGRQRRKAMLPTIDTAAIDDADFRGLLQATTQAIVEWCAGNYRRASEHFGELVRFAASKGDLEVVASLLARIHALTWQAACETRLEELAAGGSLLREVEQLLGGKAWPNCRGWWHAERGRLAFWQDDIKRSLDEYARAEQAFLQAAQAFSPTDNRFALANLCEGLARIRIHEGQYTLAQQQLTRAECFQEPHDQLGLAKRLYHWGRIYRYQKNWDQAVSHLERALAVLLKQVDNRRWEAHVRDVLGDVYLLLEDLPRAK
jgi:tetratricopeptide (TPR) repeat protein